MGHDLLTIYWLKGLEYILAVLYLPIFVVFWKFTTPKAAAEAAVPAAVPARDDQLAGYFHVPAGLFFHHGHAWARVDGPDTVTVGLDDFAQRLVGPIDRLRLPRVGTGVAQGAPAVSVEAARKRVPVLSPVTGTVLEVNQPAAARPATVKESPYGEGWLFRVQAPALPANLSSLMSGTFARRWMEAVTDQLTAEFTPAELGRVYADGGAAVDGLARVLAPDAWDAVARRYLLTDREGGRDA